MHSPEVLAFSVRNPIPRRQNKKRLPPEAHQWKSPFRRSGFKIRFSPFMHLAGYEYYFEDLLMVWHYEPGNKDALTVCQKKHKDKNGKWHYSKGWKWHFWHWKVSPSILYKWRRRLFTRCAECGGASVRGNPVNVSNGGWDGGPKVPIWCGEVHLFHSACISKVTKQHHAHDPKGCYNCSGASSFDYNRKKAYDKNLRKFIFGDAAK